MKGLRVILPTILLLLIWSSAITSLNAQCLTGNCQNGSGAYRYTNGAKYYGQFADGKPHGKGTMDYNAKSRYAGDWKNGVREGQGSMIYQNGDIYVGPFTKGRVQGDNGTMTYAKGDKYVGQWVSDQPNGQGVYHFKSGERYEGQFKSGDFEGQGKLYYPDRAYFEGLFKENKKHGLGKLVKPNGEVVEGSWNNGTEVNTTTTKPTAVASNNQKPTQSSTAATTQPPARKPTPPSIAAPKTERENTVELRNCNSVYCTKGKGYFDYSDGTRWIGEFKDGLPYGKGVCFYSNGDRYDGEWQNNAPNGEGIMKFATGRVYGAVWANGIILKELDSNESVPSTPVSVDVDKRVKIYAVIVGVGRYSAMPSLKFTDDDAFRFYSFLKSPEGGALPDNQIAVLVDESATRENILRTMREYFLKADANDVVMLYFSGHGLEGCFLPVDYDGFNNKLRHEEIKQVFNQSKAKHKLCIADACHSGSLNLDNRFAAKGPVNVTLDRYYQAFEDSDGGIALLMSSKAEELSLEDHGLRQGVFTYFILRGLKGAADTDSNQLITVDELYQYVYIKVREYTTGAQTPVLTGKFDKNMPVAVRR